MDEIRRVFKVILRSTRKSLTVTQLLEAYKQVTNSDFPLEDLEYWDVLDVLTEFPDILSVKGNTLDSEVVYLEPQNHSHKKNRVGKNGGFYSAGRRGKNGLTPKTFGHNKTQKGMNKKQVNTHCTQFPKNSGSTEDHSPWWRGNEDSEETTVTTEIRNSNISRLPEVDVTLKPCTYGEFLKERGITLKSKKKHKNKYKTVKHIAKEAKKPEEKEVPEKKEIKVTENKDMKVVSRYPSDCSNIPRSIKQNLTELIEEFPEGIWCTQLLPMYKHRFGKELQFERFGYKCLINMCLDLEDVFHCCKESICDYKLYDARRPIPKLKYFDGNREYHSKYSKNAPRTTEEDECLSPSDVYVHLFPEDAIDNDVVIPRDFVTLAEYHSEVFRVIVAEIYDPSKFWLIRDDGKLEALTRAMQSFYDNNKFRYRVTDKFLQVGLYCVAVALNEFHRCVIIRMEPSDSFVKVFFIDYGSLRKIPKDEVWFLKRDFADLPAQAIRARLANIYPPTEGTTWSTEATNRFRELADMEHLEATITNVAHEINTIEVCLAKSIMTLGEDINSVLVQEGHALYTTQARKKAAIRDYNCITRVNNIHLLPDFEEIENWLVPSVEEIEEFSKTDMTADFHLLQYFSRPVDVDDSVERTAQESFENKNKPVKCICPEELLVMQDITDNMKLSYGDLYEQYEEQLIERVKDFTYPCSFTSWGNWEDFAKYLPKARVRPPKPTKTISVDEVQVNGSSSKDTPAEVIGFQSWSSWTERRNQMGLPSSTTTTNGQETYCYSRSSNLFQL